MWECRRARDIWDFLQSLLRSVNVKKNITIREIFAGFNPKDELTETLVTKVTQALLQIDRSNIVSQTKIKTEIRFLGIMNKNKESKEIWKQLVEKCE